MPGKQHQGGGPGFKSYKNHTGNADAKRRKRQSAQKIARDKRARQEENRLKSGMSR